jgi:hypothetical protein
MKWFNSPLSSHLIEELVYSYLIMFSIYDSVIYLFSLNVALCFVTCPLPSLSQGVTFRYSVLRSVVINLAVVLYPHSWMLLKVVDCLIIEDNG